MFGPPSERLLVPFTFRAPMGRVSMLTTLTTFGTRRDVTPVSYSGCSSIACKLALTSRIAAVISVNALGETDAAIAAATSA